jgi:hypothetical protein
MHRFAAFSFAVLLASATLAAQRPAETHGLYAAPEPAGRDCPVSMRAQQKAGGDVLVARDGRPQPLSQRIHLVLGNLENPPKVVAAKVTVRGTNGKSRALPTVVTLHGAGETTKTLNLRFDGAGNGEASADLSLSGFTSVSSIRLDSLTFADGSTWSSWDGKSCSTVPDPFMLVSSR